MDKFEKKLLSIIDQPTPEPDSDEFLAKLHTTIQHRQKVRRGVLSTVTALTIAIIITIGMFNTMSDGNLYPIDDEEGFLFFSTIDDDVLLEDDWLVDDEFVYDVLEYLVQESDLVGVQPKIIEELDSFGIIDNNETKKAENKS